MINKIKELLSKGVKKNHFPGASFAIIHKDGTIEKDFVGYKQTTPTRILNKGNEIYDCASLTKVICTTSMIMKLIETKQLSLSTKVFFILPSFKHHKVTIYHLLTHTSGLPADVPKAHTLKNKDDLFERIYAFDLINPVGEKIVYSDIGFILLGQIISKVTKKPLKVYAREVIFNPLKMEDTSYSPDKTRCAPTEFRNDNVHTGLLQGFVHDEKAFACNGFAGHAGMFSTVNDLSKYILSILRNDELVLKKEAVDNLFLLQEKDTSNGNLLVRALGWDKPTKGGTAGDNVSFENTIVHTGFTGCNIWIERKLGIGFVMLSNAVHPKRENNNIKKYRNKIGNMIISLEVK